MTNNQQSLRIEIAPHIRFIFFDQSDLQRILNELLNNACKYTAPGGKICLSIQGKGPIQITVGNEAEISPEELPRLFERFYRGRVSKHSQEGTGLGLALVKRLVERVDGNIQVTSANGWTQFCIEIPLLNELSVRDQWEN
jgi:signal transduction histidine kinase